MARTRAPLGMLVFLARAGLAENRAITALLVLAISAGVAFQIANTANLAGYNAELLAQAITNGYGELRVMPRRGARFPAAPIAKRLGEPELGREIAAAVPVLAMPGAIGKDGVFRNAPVIAVDGAAARKPFVAVTGGLPPGDVHGVLVGTAIAERMKLAIGDPVELRIVTAAGAPGLDLDDGVAKLTVVVRGTAAGTFSAPDSVFVDRALLVAELADRDPASLIAIHLRPGADVDATAARLAAALPDHVVRTWKDDSAFATSAIESSAALGGLSRWMVGFAVIVPVWALLYIHVLHRRRAIAVIHALGIGRGTLFAVYLLQALLVGIAGSVIGGALGYGAIRYFDAYPLFRTDVFEVRPVVTLGTFAWPVALVLAFTLAAAVIPALRAARTDPAAILRGRT